MRNRPFTGAAGFAPCMLALSLLATPADARQTRENGDEAALAPLSTHRMLNYDEPASWSDRQTRNTDADAVQADTPRRRRSPPTAAARGPRLASRGPSVANPAANAATPPANIATLPADVTDPAANVPNPAPSVADPAANVPSPTTSVTGRSVTALARGSGGQRRSCLTAPAQALLGRIESEFGPMQIVSTCRPGARIRGTGRISRHASGNAIDFNAGGRKGEVVRWLIANHKAGGVMTYADMSHIHVDIGYHFVALNSGGSRRR